MEILWCTIFVVCWCICGVFSYGFSFAYWQREWPILAEDSYEIDRAFSIAAAPLGPISLIVALLNGMTKHGLKWK